jgi:uncharacterized protein YecT (DUF1311 family)
MIRRAAIALVLASQAGLADPSLECSVGSGSQVEISNCLETVDQAANAALAVMLSIARDNAADLDGITERKVAVPALDAGQNAWEAYRDAQCNYAGALFGGGSGTGIAIQSCRIELTRARIAALEASLN